eukprot:113466_1
MSAITKKIVFGYIHHFCGYLMAVDVTNLCVLFFDEELRCIFKEEKLKKLLSMNNGECVYTQDIQYNDDLTFWCTLVPNGLRTKPMYDKCIGYLQSFLSIKIKSEKVKHCTVSFTLYCDELEAEYRALKRFKSTTSKSGFLCDLKLSECKKLNQLTFRCIIHCLTIQYNKECDYKQLYYPSKTKVIFQINLKFKWNLNASLLEKFKNCVCGQRYNSPNFGNFCLCIAPNGTHEPMKETLEIILKILKWPNEIKRMTVSCELCSNYDASSQKYIHELDLGKTRKTIVCAKNAFLRNHLKDELVFNIHVKILDLYDETDQQILVDEWDKYGFIP